MKKISSRLQNRMAAAAPAAILRLIVTLSGKADWPEGLKQLAEAGLQVESAEEAIGAVSGKATAESVLRIAALPAVGLVELDEEAETLD